LISQNQDVLADTQFSEVFSDNFNRSDGVMGNGWEENGTAWSIASNMATASQSSWSKPLTRPSSENVQNGKAVIEIGDSSSSTVYGIVARYGDTDGSGGDYYIGYVWPSLNNFTIARVHNLASPASGTIIENNNSGNINGTIATAEFIVESLDETTTQLTLNGYNGNGDLLRTLTTTDTTSYLQDAGAFGINAYQTSGFKSFASYEVQTLPTVDSLTPDVLNVKVGEPITLDLGSPTEQNVSLSDNGAGGAFGASSVNLAAGVLENSTTYTPSRAGNITITGTFQGGTIDAEIFATPYSTNIGFVGDSITYGVNSGGMPNAVESQVALLGSGYAAVNRAVNGSDSGQWVANAYNMLSVAKTQFSNGGVEIAQIMLGTNDAAADISTADYKSNLETIIVELKTAGVKKFILNKPASSNYADVAIQEYTAVLKELVDGESVFYGDDQAYDYLLDNYATAMADVVHPNAVGHAKLGEFWADAYNRVIIDPITTAHNFVGGNQHQISDGSDLNYVVDKDFAWFNVGAGNFANVLVDDAIVDPADYTAASGSTEITLSADYLDTLSVGSHTLTVRFTDGVNFANAFEITAKATNPTNPANPTSPFSPAVPTVPDTGLGLTRQATVIIAGLITVITALAITFVNRKLKSQQ
jgi:lysophospholipase L1-like esterase